MPAGGNNAKTPAVDAGVPVEGGERLGGEGASPDVPAIPIAASMHDDTTGKSQARTADLEVPTDQGDAGGVDPPTAPLELGPVVEPPSGKAGRGSAEARRVAPDPEAGQVVGGYELLQKLGRGGAGSVFQARRMADGQIVALKVLAASKAKRARIVQRFFDEVRASSAVVHPGLIKVLDFIEEDDPRRLAYAMEYLDGESLRERLKRDGPFDLREAIQIGIEVCDALSALHEVGIIHRDLKPENIMLLKNAGGTMPRVKLLDFGVVKFLPVDRTGGSAIAEPGVEERAGTFVGTPRYMAPEQAAGGSIDARADLFAVGVLLFEMITGSCPHEGDSLRDVVMAKLKGAPRIKVNPEKEILPQELTDVVDACLQLKPPLRPKSAREVSRALREAVAVLFVVGPVKADETGGSFRLVAHPTPTPSDKTPPVHERPASDPLAPRPTPPPVGSPAVREGAQPSREVVVVARETRSTSSSRTGPSAPSAPSPSSAAGQDVPASRRPGGPGATAGQDVPLSRRTVGPEATQGTAGPVSGGHKPLSGGHKPVSKRAAPTLRRNRTIVIIIVVFAVLAVALVTIAVKIAPSEEEMLLVPLEAPSNPATPGSGHSP